MTAKQHKFMNFRVKGKIESLEEEGTLKIHYSRHIKSVFSQAIAIIYPPFQGSEIFMVYEKSFNEMS